ncbi:MAG: T9SS type A sorting domain-containing protein [Bacteroidota bacterium]
MKFKTKIILVLLLLTLQSRIIKAQVNIQDSLALVDLYKRNGGQNWTNNTNWVQFNMPVKTWFGITITNNRVTSIILINNNLSYIIPSSIGNLTMLKYLYLNMNKLVGSIPLTLGNLSNLYSLDLSSNRLTDSIPSSLGNLNSLSSLELSDNLLTGSIPTSFGKLTSLNNLSINRNKLSDSISSSLGNASNLKTIGLSYNQLSGNIPSSFGNLTNLTNLSLDGNQISGSIPTTIGNLTNLTELSLTYNKLTGSIPSSFGNLYGLTYLYVSNNMLSGQIPSSLGYLTNIINMDLSHNNLSDSIPSTISNLTKLIPTYNINISNNNLTFNGLEYIIPYNIFPNSQTLLYYSPQAVIPLRRIGNNKLSVSVGGSPNNYFKWYLNNGIISQGYGDSIIIMAKNGYYHVVVTNPFAKDLTLYSDTLTLTNLPLKKIDLQAVKSNNKVLLEWETYDELNTASFTIQHSIDGTTFDNIGSLFSIGSGNNSYRYTHINPKNSLNFYRIVSIDKDGSYSYSDVVSANLNDNNILTIYPNPSKNIISIKSNHIASVKLIDNIGRVVSVDKFQDINNPTIQVQNLPSGIYYVITQDISGNTNGGSFIKE